MESPIQALRYFLIAIGCCLLIAGSVLLLWFGQMVYQIVTEPEEVRIIQFIMEHISNKEGPVIFGSSSEHKFELSLSESAKTFAFFFLSIFALGVLSGIVKALVSGGVEIIKGALAIPALPEANENSQSSQRIYPTRKN